MDWNLTSRNRIQFKSQDVEIICVQIIGYHVGLWKMWIVHGEKTLFELKEEYETLGLSKFFSIFKDDCRYNRAGELNR